MKWGVLTFALATVALLAGCNEDQNDGICATPSNDVMSGDWKTCVHRWSYRLASAPGTNREIAAATVAGCVEAIEWEGDAEKAAIEATGDFSNPPKHEDKYAAATNLALFRVVQARAGHCEIPK